MASQIRDAESLFRSKPISEIRNIKPATRKEIESKNQELRQLVFSSPAFGIKNSFGQTKIDSKQVSESAVFGRSLFERLSSCGLGKDLLNMQYRIFMNQ
ncbi:hypothetical protein AAC387_Pa09g0625 [Persea americana]